MVDKLSAEHRSWNMSRIRGKDTKPELTLRSMLHRVGYRYRLYDKKLPGRPDIVLPKYRTAIFVNGCFWHRHEGCPDATTPGTRTAFWKDKFECTVKRDKLKTAELESLGWKVITVWECDLRKDSEAVLENVCHTLEVTI